MAPPTLTHLLLDIEGTTCPVSFVAETLFPFARRHLPAYLARHRHDPEVAALLGELERARAEDADAPGFDAVSPSTDGGLSQAVAYLDWLMEHDRKLTPLKQLQGLVWESGYADGSLMAPLYPDVAPALALAHRSGLTLTVYSSGSVPAQQLLYAHTPAGDLRPLFQHWFDTRTGAKQEPQSYRRIAAAMGADPARILFVSDATGELRAAAAAGLQVLFSDRPGNPERDPAGFASITSFAALGEIPGSGDKGPS
jgi:enolase-phosphatase E1